MPSEFARWFDEAFGRPAYAWQTALGDVPDPGHRVLRIPTGFGKTHGVLGAWLFHRVVRGDKRWPLRLVWTLPMRTLVEQTEAETRWILAKLGMGGTQGSQVGKVGAHVLMGGADSGPWHLHPEVPAVLIGTQDMLLSRALNRGYGAARARWPVDFGLLSQDTLWVLDEVQLMGVGFATALQLAAFRRESPGMRPTHTWAMSATLQKSWLEKSPDTKDLSKVAVPVRLTDGDTTHTLWKDSEKPIQLCEAMSVAAQARFIRERHARLQKEAPLTLVVCNTVDRARAVYDELCKQASKGGPEVRLLHSRFRGTERGGWAGLLRPSGPVPSRVIVATQVIEAGVDLSADLLITEACPWPSLVQRLGRLARRGGRGEAFVLPLDPDKQAAPYEPDAMRAALDALALIEDASPRALEAFEQAHPELLEGLYLFDPPHFVLREEIVELFDTTADLEGADLDVSRFIREGDERDVSVFWAPLARDARGRPLEPSPALRPLRGALCAVPFTTAREWLCGKGTKGKGPSRLIKRESAWVWDYLDGRYRVAERADLRPGAVVLVDSSLGGYSTERGFDPSVQSPVPVVELGEADAQERADAAQDQEDLSFAQYQTIGFHGGAVAAEVAQMSKALELPERLARLLHLAGRWHDVGKSHPAFQGAIDAVRRSDRPVRCDLAKAPADAWVTGKTMYRVAHENGQVELRPGFRHELASALSLFDVLRRWAPAAHPSRLGALAAVYGGVEPRGGDCEPSAIEREVLALDAADFDLVAFLVCAHHGKVRARLHASPADQDAAVRQNSLPIRGVYEGDALPALTLQDALGVCQQLPVSRLTLEPATLGLSSDTGRSWTERVDTLRAAHGPFSLAFLEAIIRAADVRASADRSLIDPALAAPAVALGDEGDKS
jgi:CRISPR-associated endonuclease/helicase Cas3